MARLTILHQRIDRDRLHAFGWFLWQRFVSDKCFETAGALSYTTLFALVPLLTAVLAILAAFPVFAEWRMAASDFVFRNFVPAAGATVQNYLLQFAANASKLTAVGIVFLLASALMMMSSIEDRFNRIWRVQTARGGGSRLLLYWAALTIGPLLIVAGLALLSRVVPLTPQANATPSLPAREAFAFLPFALTWLVLLAMYMLIPNRTVAFRHAGIAALVAAILFQVARVLFAWYVQRVPSYQQIYGALAAAPIFLIWIYFSWVIVLLGASLAAAMAAFEYRPASERLPAGCEFIGLLRVLRHFVYAQREGRGLHSEELCRRERFLGDDLLQRYLGDLHRAGLLARAESGGWVLIRDLATVNLADLYRAGRYRLPLDRESAARALDGLGEDARDAVVAAIEALRARLDAPLSGLFPARSRASASGAES
ncbi:MAG: YihY family inner membrane protein [Proteobacteria bacterium]|nr:YihY family inner membrane protein [Pseudomonadota bacterium]